ncbi:Isocyanide synthase xanB [Cladobotryum mycophilum]|uniref:Isocyanide synthase xanB n=1 Tax=Cladobotryum mycophilum TaxID=491253 RepID=A0ABR0T4B0_9HYPO
MPFVSHHSDSLASNSPDGSNASAGDLLTEGQTSTISQMPQFECSKALARGRMLSLIQKDIAETMPAVISLPPQASIVDRAKAAIKLLNRYRIEYQNDWEMPESILKSQSLIEDFLHRGESIELIMPAFPFKSSNKSKKVLGPLPDEAERVSLLHLNGLCESIRDVTHHNVHLVIISDGISYNDLLGVSDTEVWAYGQALRSLSQESGCRNIRFARIHELLGEDSNGPMTQDQYLSQVAMYRIGLEQNLPGGYDVAEEISNDPDTTKTYCGYKKFLETERDVRQSRSRNEKENAAIAKKMLRRGKAFAESIRKAYPHSIRLSIHPSTDANKTSIILLPQDNQVVMTPWHGAVVRNIDGSITMMHARDVPAMTYELIYENDRPTYFRQRSKLFEWNGKDLHFEYLYPTGIMVRPRKPHSEYALCTVDMHKVRLLAEQCSPIVMRGFTETMSRRAFTAKAYDLGDPVPWNNQIIKVVKDVVNMDPASDNVVSSEAMPMHYDGIFKFKTVIDEISGQEKRVSDLPRFQYFVSQSVAAPGDGHTLFASSARFTRHLPHSYNLQKLSKIRWTVGSHGFYNHTLGNLPLIVPHPTLGTPCVRWHQPWSRWQTAYTWADIKIDNGSQNLIELVDSLLFDRRVCLYFTWEVGDVLVSDNFAMLHTLKPFGHRSGRELWRIHTT